MRLRRGLPIVVTVGALIVAGTEGVAFAADVPTESNGGSIVTNYAYPGAAAILESEHVSLIAGDGHIALADCLTPPANNVGVMKVWTTEPIGPSDEGLVCFKVSGPVGWLTLAVPGVYEIRGDGQASGTGHKVTANVTTDEGVQTTVNVNPSGSTQVGLGADPDNDPTTLVELRVNDVLPPGTVGQYPFVARIDVNGRGCSGVLVQAQYVATSKTCFAADGNVSAGPAPASAKAVIGRPDVGQSSGVALAITELIPRNDRDLVLAKLASPISPVTGITPVKLATTPSAMGATLTGAGFGHTATDWAIGTLHTGVFNVATVTPTTLELSRATGTATSTCDGDSGGPTFRSIAGGQVELVAIHSASWQTGCFGVTETRDLAVETRVDDLNAWITANTTTTITRGDVNGDGLSDLAIAYDSGNAQTKLLVGLFNGPSKPTALQTWSDSGAGNLEWGRSKVGFGDFDGDGLVDVGLLYNYGNGAAAFFVFRSTGTGFAPRVAYYTTGVGGLEWDRTELALGDFNGDGKTDLGILYNYGNASTSLLVALSNGTSMPSSLTNWFNSGNGNLEWDRCKVALGDYNGDGKTDLAVVYNYGNASTSLLVSLSTGTSMPNSLTNWYDSGNGNLEWDRSKVAPGDYNGDGKTDFAIVYNYGNASTSLLVSLSNGTSVANHLTNWFDSGNGNLEWDRSKVAPGDYNGDGKTDLGIVYNYGNGSTSLLVSLSNGTSVANPWTNFFDSGNGNLDWNLSKVA